ncbi:hypothetical protein DRJ16_02875 [Candidatus Woesearchaeota archaeon]|nr:MAG: hypothetical protein DRJ16_02875 [Candidatus Woesearchaeota archaeon]
MAIIGYAGNSVDAAKIFGTQEWSKKILAFNKAKQTVRHITNEDYAGAVKKESDVVNIARDIMPIIKPYARGQDFEYQNEEIQSTQLVIDKAFYAGNKVEPIDERYSALNRMNMWTKNVGYGFGMYVDKTILNDIYTDADPSNRGTAAGVETKSVNLGATGAPLLIDINNCIEVIESMALVFDEIDTPEEGRTVIIPPKWFNLCLQRMHTVGFYADAKGVLEQGQLPKMIAGFKVYKSNQYNKVVDTSAGNPTCYNVVFSLPSATTKAENVIKSKEGEDMRNAYLYRYHLQVLGYKVIQPTHIGTAYITF